METASAVVGGGTSDLEERVKIVKIPGGSLEDSSINYGIIMEKEVTSPGMPKKIQNARIMLLEGTLEIKKLGTDAKISITDVGGLQSFKQSEEDLIADQINAIVKAGANVVFVQKGIGNFAQGYLAKKGILAARRVKDEDMKMLASATGAKLVGDPLLVRPEDLGSCGLVEERKVGKDKQMIFVEGCKNPKSVSIILRGVSEVFLDEMERALEDALHVVTDVLESGKIVPGGGAAEFEVAENLRQYASTVSGREQLAVIAFSKAVESIPITLAENGGFNPVDSLVALRSSHQAGQKISGINMKTGKA